MGVVCIGLCSLHFHYIYQCMIKSGPIGKLGSVIGLVSHIDFVNFNTVATTRFPYFEFDREIYHGVLMLKN